MLGRENRGKKTPKDRSYACVNEKQVPGTAFEPASPAEVRAAPQLSYFTILLYIDLLALQPTCARVRRSTAGVIY